MAFSPEEIENREFTAGLRGYDVDEVSRFLKVIAQDYRLMLGGGSPGEATAEATDLSHIGQEVNSILESANAAAVKLAEEAQARAASAVEDAEGRAQRIVAEAEGRAQEIVEAAEGRALEIVAAAESDTADRVAALETDRVRLAEAHLSLTNALRNAEDLFEAARADVAGVASSLQTSLTHADVVTGPPPAPPAPEEAVDEGAGPEQDFGAPVSIGQPSDGSEEPDEPPAPPELNSNAG